MKHRSILFAALGVGFLFSASAPAALAQHGGRRAWRWRLARRRWWLAWWRWLACRLGQQSAGAWRGGWWGPGVVH